MKNKLADRSLEMEVGETRRKKKRCGMGVMLAAFVGLMALATVFMPATPASAQGTALYRWVNFTNYNFPTAYAPSMVWTNNGTNWFLTTGTNVPAITNATSFTSATSGGPTNMATSPPLYIGKDWLPFVPTYLELGVYAPSGTNGYYTNYLQLSPDLLFWGPTNQIAVGGQLTSGVTNWFYVPVGPFTNAEWAVWDGVFSSQTNGVYVIGWRYQVPHPAY